MGDLVNAATSGDKRATLIALRDVLAEQIEEASPRDLAALSRQLTDVLNQLDEIPDKREVSPADEIARRRIERRKHRKPEAPAQSGS